MCFRSADEAVLAEEFDLSLVLGTAFSPVAVPFVPKFTVDLMGLLILLIFDGWLGALSSAATWLCDLFLVGINGKRAGSGVCVGVKTDDVGRNWGAVADSWCSATISICGAGDVEIRAIASDNNGTNLDTKSVTALVQLTRDVAVSLTVLLAQWGQNQTKPRFSFIVAIAAFFTFTQLMWKAMVHILHLMKSLLVILQATAEHFGVVFVIFSIRTTGFSTLVELIVEEDIGRFEVRSVTRNEMNK